MPARNHTRWKEIPGQIKSGEYVDSRIYSDENIFKKAQEFRDMAKSGDAKISGDPLESDSSSKDSRF